MFTGNSETQEEISNKISDIGFSGHHLGINIDNVAYALVQI